jgi:apolipoprotein N-acyltransferase
VRRPQWASVASPASLAWLAFAAAGGVLWAFCFGRRGFVVAPWIALAPLVLLLGSPRPGWLGWVHGLAAWLGGLYWIVPTLQTYGGIGGAVAVALTSLLCAYLGLYHAAFARLGAPLWRRFGAWNLLLLPSLWAALEWLRTYLGGGFPWNVAAYAWVEVPGALPLSAWVGPYGISFLVVLANVAVADFARRRRWQPALAGLLVPLLLLPVAGRWSVRELGEGPPPVGRPVRLLQPNIPNLVDFDPVAVWENYRTVLDLSIANCRPGTLVVWPESAAWPFSYATDEHLARDLDALVARGCTVLFNSSFPAGEDFYNSAFLLAPGRPAVRYDKRHLVPFGEYVPFRGVFGWMDKLARNAGNFLPAGALALLPWDEELLGMSICYEIVFPDEVADLTQAGATVLVTITNDAWYGDTTAPWQHFRAARFRAAENRRPLLRAAITGVSAVVGPDGAVWADLGVFEPGVIQARVEGARKLSPYARLPWLVPALCTMVAVGGLAACYTFRRRKDPRRTKERTR